MGATGLEVLIVPSANRAAVYDGAISTIDGSPSGTSDGLGDIVNATYSGSSLERSSTINLALGEGNFAADIKSLRFSYQTAGTWQAEFDPVIPKDNTKTLSFDVEVSWTRTTAL